MEKTGISYEEAVVGQCLGSAVNYATREAIQAYARSTEDYNPIYWDEDAAKKAGYRTVIAPGGFHLQYTAFKWATGVARYFPRGSIHIKERYGLLKNVFAGDCLTTTVFISDKYQKKGRDHIVYRLEITNQDNELVGFNEMDLILSEGE